MEIQEVVKMYNQDGLSLSAIANHYGVSKSTVSRFLTREGYVLNAKLKMYLIQEVNDSVSISTCETVNTENNIKVKEEINKTMKKLTFDIPEELHRQLKSKCALNGEKMVDYVRKLIEKSI